MSANYDAKLADMGITLPTAPAPAAKYVPFVVIEDMVYVSGQISQDANGLIKGKLGDDMDTEAGAAAARTCALGLMAQLKAACDGNLDRLVRVVKLTGFVNSTPDFTEQPQVINGASNLFGDVFGDAGHTLVPPFPPRHCHWGLLLKSKAFFRSNNAQTRFCVFENSYRASCIA